MVKPLGFPKRGEIYLVNFDPTIGSEIQKNRPAIILQNDVANEYSSITIVAAIFSQFDSELYLIEVIISPSEGGLIKPSVVLLNQICSIDKQRLTRKIGSVSDATIQGINKAIQVSC